MERRLFSILPLLFIYVGVYAKYADSSVLKKYTVHKVLTPVTIDGMADDTWQQAPWSEPFIDIEGNNKPTPYLTTRMKMLWNDDYLYVLAQLEETDLWASLTEHDAIIYRDHDFEIFIDPDRDQENYFEIEINTFGTVLDLFMDKTYSNGGIANLKWNAAGLLSAVVKEGTINQNNDTDKGWTVEMAIPFNALNHAGNTYKPVNGQIWKINFSRVEWTLDKQNATYKKRTGKDGKPLPEFNWVWSPQGIINMHYPEKWGLVYFED